MTNTQTAAVAVQDREVRSNFYTNACGDTDKVKDTQKSLRNFGFKPTVFKKIRKNDKAKGVDIALTTDILSDAFSDNYDVAVLITGDGDFIPVIHQVQRLGKLVYVAFLANPKFMSEDLQIEADHFFGFTGLFEKRWRENVDSSPPGEKLR